MPSLEGGKSLARAKELFFYYCGSFFHMDREGDYQEYIKYKVSKEQEEDWKNELVELKVSQLSFNEITAFSNLAMIASTYYDYRIVERLIAFVRSNINEGDSLIKLIFAEILLNIACPKELTASKIQVVFMLLGSVSNHPVTVSPTWKGKPFAELPDEEYIRIRLNKDMDWANDIKKRYCD